jgi:protein-S-isoprenylcysteine O-methyltransferase Ste14
MFSEVVSAVLLVVPLVAMIIPSIRYWSEFTKEKNKARQGKKANYNRLFFYSLVVGVLCMWIAWVGSIVLLFQNKYYSDLDRLTFPSPHEAAIQVVGFVVFYIGGIGYNMSIIAAGKHLRPAPSGTLEDHRLIQEGPFAVIRHLHCMCLMCLF